MLKSARKPSTDPSQERLRAAKEVWNKDVSAFITENVLFRKNITLFNNDLIHFKKLMNGAANKFHMQRSHITHEIPVDPATISGSLVEDFNKFSQKASELAQQFSKLSQRANDIANQQIEYSRTRRKKRNESSPSTQLTLPGIGANLEYKLIAEASNPFSRFMARITIPKYGESSEAQIGRYRLNILKLAITLFKLVNKFSTLCVSDDDDAMVKIAISFNSDIIPKWQNLCQIISLDGERLASLNNTKSDSTSDSTKSDTKSDSTSDSTKSDSTSKTERSDIKSKEQLEKLKPEISQDTKSVVSDIDIAIKEFRQSYSNQSLSQRVARNLVKLERARGDYELPSNSPEEKNKAAEAFIKEWNRVKRENKRASSMAEVDDYIIKVAQESITNWIGKKKLERNANTIQLSIYNNSNFIKDELDHLMNLVEDGFNFSEIKKTEEKIKKYFSTIQSNLFTQKSLLTNIDSKVLLDNLGNTIQGITDSEKASVENSMRKQRMRNLYNKVNI